MAADRTSGGLHGAEGDGSAGYGGGEGVFGEDGEEEECWHELKDEDGSGWSCILLCVYGKGVLRSTP